MREHVLITGGAGFLGSHLTDRLLAAGARVRILDALDPQVHPCGVPTYLAPEAELRIGSVLDPAALDQALEDVTAVAHFAAVVGVGQSQYQIARYTAVNLQGTAELLQAMLRRQRQRGSGIGRLLLAGSMSIYGEGRYWCAGCGLDRASHRRPIGQLRRQQWDPRCPVCQHALEPRATDEDKPPQLSSFYSISKQVQEEMCQLFGRAYAVPTVVLRFFNTYGPRQALANPYTGVAAVFAAELLAGRHPHVFEDGLQMRDFVSVHDVSAACQLALGATFAGGETFNIASGQPLAVAELAAVLARTLGRQLDPVITGRYRLGDARHCYADIGAATTRLGFRPLVPLAEGLHELAQWLERQPAAADSATPHHAVATEELAVHGLTG